MAELRSVDPRTLKPNPDNPRTIAVPKEMDQQLTASIAAIGLLQPPVVREIAGELVIRAGDRRTRSAIAAGKDVIDVYVLTANEDIDPMAAMSENLVRVGLNPVDTWRGIDKLEQQGWNEDAIAAALALPARTVRKLKLLGKLHPPMLDFMAKGSMPNDEQLRTIANASVDDQAQVWKRYKPKKGHDVSWWEVSRALSKPRIPFSAAKFDDKLAEEFGVVWVEDMFAPAGEDGRYTTNAEGFFGAQEAWMRANLPERGAVLTLNEFGQPELPKKAERVYGKPQKGDITGHYVDHHSGEVRSVVYRMPPEMKKRGKTDHATQDEPPAKPPRPDVTQKGVAMIGDLRTDALHQALDNADVPNETLIGLLILALGARNVSVHTTSSEYGNREAICKRISEGGLLSADQTLLHAAARDMLKVVLSCRANMTDSGINSRIAGQTLGASDHLPSMATEEFLSCLSRQALERSAAAEGVRVEPRVKDTRAALIAHCQDCVWRFPGALFTVTPEEFEASRHSESMPDEDEADDTPDDADDYLADLADEDGAPGLPVCPAAAE